MRVLWISGWAISPSDMLVEAKEKFPHYDHECIPPTQEAFDRINENKHDTYVGYSLGGCLLMACESIIPESIYLLAPIVETKEKGMHERQLSKAQIEWLYRLVQQEPKDALKRFYAFAQLRETIDKELPYSQEELLWGLEYLQKPIAIHQKPTQVVSGADDPLIDSCTLQKVFPNATLVNDASHDYRDLLSYLQF